MRAIAAGLALTAMLAAVGAAAQAPKVPQAPQAEYDVKAAYLYNFARFVEWPAAARRQAATFDICVLGQDPFGPRLEAVLGDATVKGKPLAARRVTSADAAAAACDVLFISASEERDLPRILEGLAGANVLTVSDMPEFVSRGGMLQFVPQGSRIRFDVNLAACEAVGLRVSSDLLRVAGAVRKGR